MKHPIFQLDTDLCTDKVLKMFEEVMHDVDKYHPEFITPEQILYGIIYQPEFMSYCIDHEVSFSDMGQEVFSYLMNQDHYLGDEEGEPIPSQQMLELMEYVANDAQEDKYQEYTIPDILLSIDALIDSEAAFFLEKYLGGNEHWHDDIWDYYTDDIEDFHKQSKGKGKARTQDAQDGEEVTEGEEVTDGQQMPEGLQLPGMPPLPGGHIIAAEAFVNGKRIDLSQGDLYQKLMASAGRLMSSINALGAVPGKKKAKNTKQEEKQHEPWEDTVTCLNDIYMKKNPLIGRQKELSRAIRILCRKDKNNPLFIGEAGVGKTALIYGLTRLIEEGNVPKWLQNQRIYAIDMGAMVAGTCYHGEFEKRMKEVLDGAQRRGNCIIYIDEIHTIMDTGGGNSSMNAAELLKPYLEDETVRFIGTTTYQDYNKSIANNKAISRRFGKIDIKEPSVEETVEIIQQLTPIYEKHHGVRYAEEAIRYAVEQSDALIHDRYLPDKAIDIIDEAGAYLQQNPLLNKKGEPKQARYQKIDKALIKHILTDVCRIEANALASESNDNLKDLDKRISGEIYGQDEAIRQVVRSVMMSKAGLLEPDKPLASLLFVGPTGVGKTEVCKVLAKELGIELVRFDMSEYTEKHTISKLIGSPAGYIGYEEGGLLTDAIRKTPNCVLLLDEIEKAHSDIYNILLQVMDYARLTDNKGNKADFRNVILIMTSNAGAQYAGQAGIGFSGGQTKGQAMLQTVKKTFKPEFLNRLSGTVVFNEMDKTMASLILDKKLRQLSERLAKKSVTMSVAPEAHEFLLQKGFTSQYGAREMDRAIQQYLTPILMEEILFGKLTKGGNVEVILTGEDTLALR